MLFRSSGFSRILGGEFDALPEQAFYLVGTIEDVIEKANILNKFMPGASDPANITLPQQV